jgi:hypothetical protein
MSPKRAWEQQRRDKSLGDNAGLNEGMISADFAFDMGCGIRRTCDEGTGLRCATGRNGIMSKKRQRTRHS